MWFNITILFSFLAMFSWGIGDFFVHRVVKRIGYLEALLWINLTAAIGLLPFVIKDIPLMWQKENIVPILLITIANIVFSLLLLKAYSKAKLSVVDVILLGELPVTIILGMIFFKERLSWLQLIIIIFIIFGVFLISRGPKSYWHKIKEVFWKKRTNWEKGLFFALFAIIFSGIYNFLTALNAREISPLMAVWAPWTISSFILFGALLYKKGLKTFWQNSLANKQVIFLAGTIDTAAWVFYSSAVARQDISIITAIVTGYAVIALFLDVKYNKQKIAYWQYIGAALVVIGSIAISLLE